jgi:uncharacterized phage protein (TIGR01671 family)
MNRPIKLRAWDKADKQIFEVTSLQWSASHPDKFSRMDLLSMDGRYINRIISKPDIIEERIELVQFTGLLDHNGKEIFEGDIVQVLTVFDERQVAQVMWAKPKGSERWTVGETWIVRFENGIQGTLWPYCDEHNGYKVEIIGNVWEMPQLIEEKE